MSVLLAAVSFMGALGTWQSFTNTNFINDIAGTDSAMFVATNGGLLVLNADELTVEGTLASADGLPADRCLAVVADSHGNVWVGTNGGGLAVVRDDYAFITVYRPNDLPDKISALLWDGDRLLAASEQGLYVVESRGSPLDFDDDVVRHYSAVFVPELLSDRVLALGKLNGYWIGTNRGVTHVDTAFVQWTPFRAPLGDSVKAIDVWHDSLVVATEDGLAVLHGDVFEPVFEFADGREVRDLLISDGRASVATDTGVFQGELGDSTILTLVLAGDARALRRGDALWVGLGGNENAGHGLRYLRTGQSWGSFLTGCIASGYISDGTYNPTNGKIYVCHYFDTRGFSEIDAGTQTVTTRSGVLPVPIQVRCDREGRVWFAHFAGDGGLSCYDPESQQWDLIQWGQQSEWNIIDAFGIDASDTKWVYNGGGLIVAVDSALRQMEFDIPGLTKPPGGGYDFAFDARGRVWLGLTVGLAMLDYGGTLFDPGDDVSRVYVAGLPSTEVRSVDIDPSGSVWMATPQGAAMMQDDRLSVFTTANSGLLSNNIYRVRSDGSGRVWFLCDVGLSLYDPVSGRWTNSTPQNSGLIPNSLGLAGFYRALEIAETGYALIGTSQGLSLLDFSLGDENPERPSPLVFPNPCVLGVHQQVVVDSLPEDAAVEIRALSGRLVATLDVDAGLRRAVWRPEGVASGLYLVLVTSPVGSRVERVAVVSP